MSGGDDDRQPPAERDSPTLMDGAHLGGDQLRHEVFTPLTLIQGYAQLVRRRMGTGRRISDGEMELALDTIGEAARRIECVMGHDGRHRDR